MTELVHICNYGIEWDKIDTNWYIYLVMPSLNNEYTKFVESKMAAILKVAAKWLYRKEMK